MLDTGSYMNVSSLKSQLETKYLIWFIYKDCQIKFNTYLNLFKQPVTMKV